MSQDLTTQPEGGALAPLTDMFFEDASQGAPDFKAEDLAIPFLNLLQSGSPQCKKSDPKYIKGAEEGNILDTLTLDVYSGEEGVRVIPCAYERAWLEWKPRESGGGLITVHKSEPAGMFRDQKTGRDMLPNGNMVVLTAQYYVLFVDKRGDIKKAVVSMSSTQLKTSRTWNSIISSIMVEDAKGRKFNPRMFSHFYKLTTVANQNDKGSWYTFKVMADGMVTKDLYVVAREFAQQIKAGEVKTQEHQPDGPAASSTKRDDAEDLEY